MKCPIDEMKMVKVKDGGRFFDGVTQVSLKDYEVWKCLVCHAVVAEPTKDNNDRR